LDDAPGVAVVVELAGAIVRPPRGVAGGSLSWGRSTASRRAGALRDRLVPSPPSQPDRQRIVRTINNIRMTIPYPMYGRNVTEEFKFGLLRIWLCLFALSIVMNYKTF